LNEVEEENNNVINDTELEKIIEEEMNVPNFTTSGNDSIDELLQTEILVCEKCMHPNIIGTEKFNRRTKEVKHIKIDSVVNAGFVHFLKLNKLDANAGIALFLKILQDENVSRILSRKFASVPRRKGRFTRSNLVINEE
jgi:hypothetical protein